MIVSLVLQFLTSRVMLSMAENPPIAPGEPQTPSKEGIPPWAIVVIAVIAVPCLLVCVAVGVITILTLLGPAIGSSFSNIIEGLVTSTPAP